MQPGYNSVSPAQMQPPMTAPKEATPYDIHADAVREWFESCHEFQRTQARRAAAEKQLGEACERLAQHVQRTSCDPTATPPPPNGLSQSGQYNPTSR